MPITTTGEAVATPTGRQKVAERAFWFRQVSRITAKLAPGLIARGSHFCALSTPVITIREFQSWAATDKSEWKSWTLSPLPTEVIRGRARGKRGSSVVQVKHLMFLKREPAQVGK